MREPERFAAGVARRVEAAALTERGPVRAVNEDRFVLDPWRRRFAVVDGMGGEGGGAVAAELAADAIRTAPDADGALRRAHDAIVARAATSAGLARMGAVATLLAVDGDAARLWHVGDTRAWHVGAGDVALLTTDHVTTVHEPDGRVRHPLVRDLGTDGSPDRSALALAPGDLVVLASDGVYGALPPGELEERVARARQLGTPTDDLVRELVARALSAGSRDNATAVVVRYLGRGALRRELRRWWTGDRRAS